MSSIESLMSDPTLPTVAKHSPADVMSDEESTVNICRTKSVGSVRVGASQPGAPSAAALAKRALEEKLAALQRQLMEMENGTSEAMDVTPTEQKLDVMATPSKNSTASSTSSSPAAAADSPSVPSAQSSPAPTAAETNKEKPVVDLTSESETTPKSAAKAAKPKQPRKRKAKEPVNSILNSFANAPPAVSTPAAAPTDLSIASLTDAPLATPEAAPTVALSETTTATAIASAAPIDSSSSIASLTDSASTPSTAEATAAASSTAIKPPPAKKAKTSAPKESAEEREKRKNEEKARKDAEAAEKKAQKEREKEVEKQKKAQEAADAKAAKEREKAEERAAKQREIDEKKAEKQREIDAKKAEAEAKKSELEQKRMEKQQAIDAKKEAKQKEDEAKEAAKKKAEEQLQKSKGIMSSFFKMPSAPPTVATTTAATNTTSTAVTSTTSTTTTAAVATTMNSTTVADTPIAARAASANDAVAPAVTAPVVMSAAARERAERAAALFLPFEAASGRVWSREYSMSARRGVSSLEREKRGLALMELLLKEAEDSNAVPNLIDDTARVAQAKDNGAKRRAKCVSMNDRKKLLQFHDNYRPAWFGRIKKTLTGLMAASQPADTAAASAVATSVASIPSKYLAVPRTRRPSLRWSVPTEVLNYDVDSEDEWGEEPEDAEELDSDDLDGEDMSDSDAEGEIRGDGLEEDGWLMPEDEDPLAPKNVTDLSGPAQTTKAAGKGKNKVREIMVPVVVGPCMDLDRIVAEYFKQQKAGVDTIAELERVVLTEEMKELMAFKVRSIPTIPTSSSSSNATIESQQPAPWQLSSADIMSAYPPWLLPKKEEPVCVKDEPLPTAVTPIVELKADVAMQCEASGSVDKKEVESIKVETTAITESKDVAMECDA